MSDILKGIQIHVVCDRCGTEFPTRADVVAESQQLLESGCPGENEECPARLFAKLVDRDALRDLAEAWSRVQESVRAPAVDVDLAAAPSREKSDDPIDDTRSTCGPSESHDSSSTAVTVEIAGTRRGPGADE